MDRKLAAVLAADIVGYSALMDRDEAGTFSRVKKVIADIIAPTIAGHHGRIIKLMGDGVLAEFSSTVNAISSAIEVQAKLAEAAAGSREDDALVMRIGINLGDIIVDGDDIFGDGVNIAARLEALADPGGICISGTAFDTVDGKLECDFEDIGPQQVKNIAKPVRAFRIALSEKSADPPKPARERSIGVLPFDNMSGDPEQGYFSDGISEDVITDLSRIPNLFVAARNSSFVFRDKSSDIREVSRLLNVRYILEGSVRKAGNRVRISAQLIDGKTGGHIWADRYDRELEDIFAIQDEITNCIVDALSSALALKAPSSEKEIASVDPVAYDYALRARHLSYQYSRETNREAMRLFELAIATDPSLGLAYCGLSMNLNLAVMNGWLGTEKLYDAQLAAQKAVDLGPDDATARRVLALAKMWKNDLDGALKEADRAVSIAPNVAEVHATRGYILSYLGRSAEAVREIRTAITLDPLHPAIWLHFLAHAHYLNGDYGIAAELLERRIRREPQTDISRALLASCLGQSGKFEEAMHAWAELKKVNPDYSITEKARLLPYRRKQDWQSIVDGLAKAGINT